MMVKSKTFKAIIILFSVIFAASVLVRYFFMDPVSTNKTLIDVGLEMFTLQNKPWTVALYIHIITASIAIVIGLPQFSKKLRVNKPSLHRILGKIYVMSIFISSVIGIYLSLYAFGGIAAKLGFLCLDIAWFYTTYMALSMIKKKQLLRHEQWMYRSYAVTFAAVTFRFWSAAIGYPLDNFTAGYAIATWLCWIGNLLVVELLIRKQQRIQKQPVNNIDTNIAS